MQHGTCPTIAVKSETAPDGFIIINASDRTPEHVLHVMPPPLAPLPPPPAPLPLGPLANLPKDWRNAKTLWLIETATAICDGRAPENRAQAIEMIAAKLPPA